MEVNTALLTAAVLLCVATVSLCFLLFRLKRRMYTNAIKVLSDAYLVFNNSGELTGINPAFKKAFPKAAFEPVKG